MRQFQYRYTTPEGLREQLKSLAAWCEARSASAVIFHIFTETLDERRIEAGVREVRNAFPDALIAGASTNGNILNGDLAAGDTIFVCTVMENPATRVELLRYRLNAETEAEVTSDVIAQIAARPWVKAVEMLVTIRWMSMSRFCEDLSGIRPDVQVFGGGAFASDINEQAAVVIGSFPGEKSSNAAAFEGDPSDGGLSEGRTSGGSAQTREDCSDQALPEQVLWDQDQSDMGFSDQGAVFVLYGGDDLHIKTQRITGWKPFGREMTVTKAVSNRLMELDGKPAYDTYYHYLQIANDASFFKNTLEFPFQYRHRGVELLRAPVSCTEDGSLMMTADTEEGVRVRLAYGDPWTILESVRAGGHLFETFMPQGIFIYSCAARRYFWGEEEIGKETLPFQSLAPTCGFYTSGEFLRENGAVSQHNVTLVIAALREGEPDTAHALPFVMAGEKLTGQVSIVNRLACFISAATQELEDANRQLASANELLAKQSVTDGLTQLYNRREIQRRITSAAENRKRTGHISLVMLDIDDFKKVNDEFGHRAGDMVLTRFAKTMRECASSFAAEHALPEPSVGRWGGEEFMILLPDTDRENAAEFAELVRGSLEELHFPQVGRKTASFGVAELEEGQDADAWTSCVDARLYEAKASGKNRVCAD